jgi:hypothetical protein
VVTRPNFPNPCSWATILVLTYAWTTLGCGRIVFDVTGGDGGARDVKLSRTRFVLGCRSEVGYDGVGPPMLISRMMMQLRATSPVGPEPVRQIVPRRCGQGRVSLYICRPWSWRIAFHRRSKIRIGHGRWLTLHDVYRTCFPKSWRWP